MSAVFIHPLALCESDDVGAGTRVWPFAQVQSGAVIGEDCNICGGAYVETGVVLGRNVTVKNNVLLFSGVTCEDDVFLGPAVTFTNDLRPRAHLKKSPRELTKTRVRKGASLGAGTVVVCGVDVGPYAFAGAGSLITRDVPAHAVVFGSPARQVGWVCCCGLRLPDSLRCCECRIGYESGGHGLKRRERGC